VIGVVEDRLRKQHYQTSRADHRDQPGLPWCLRHPQRLVLVSCTTAQRPAAQQRRVPAVIDVADCLQFAFQHRFSCGAVAILLYYPRKPAISPSLKDDELITHLTEKRYASRYTVWHGWQWDACLRGVYGE